MRIIYGLFFLALAFAASFYVGNRSLGVSPFQPTSYPAQNLPFVVVVIGHNNGAYLEKSLRSALSQNYNQYRVVYIDDGSSDGSADLARDLVQDKEFIANGEPIGILSNLSRVVGECRDDEIVVVLRGDDWLAHEWVLSRLNQYYANADLWVATGKFCEYPEYNIATTLTIKKDKPLREQPFSSRGLKSFYAGLFKQINQGDFVQGDEPFQAAEDLAYMMPLLEMAGKHAAHIDEVLYVANVTIAEDREKVARCEKLIRSMAAYEPLNRMVQ